MKQPVEFKTALIILFAVLIMAIGLLISGFGHQQVMNNPSNLTLGSGTDGSPIVAANPELATTNASTSTLVDVTQGEDASLGSFVDASTGVAVVFSSSSESIQNFGYDNNSYFISVGGNVLGEVGGAGYKILGFSPDNRYFAFRFREIWTGNGAYQNMGVGIVDLVNKKYFIINLPPTSYLGTSTGDMFLYLESLEWGAGDSLNMTCYFVVQIYNRQGYLGGYQRISPKEVWGYDMVAQTFNPIEISGERLASQITASQPDDTSNWPTYTDGGNYTIKYPPGAIFDPAIGGFHLEKSIGVYYRINCSDACVSENRLTFSVSTELISDPATFSLKDMVNNIVNDYESQRQAPNIEESTTTLMGMTAYVLDYQYGLSGFDPVEFYIARDNLVYIIKGVKPPSSFERPNDPLYFFAPRYVKVFNAMANSINSVNK